MAFRDMVTLCAVTDEVVQAVMNYQKVDQRTALFMLGLRLDKNLYTKTHKVRCPKRPYMIYDAKVHHGLLRNKVAYDVVDGKMQLRLDHKGRVSFTKEVHDLQSTYETYTVVGMQELASDVELINILEHGNPDA